jgi:hypothetical protein
MATSGKDRQRKWRDKQLALGRRRLTVWIDAEAADSLDQLKKRMLASSSVVVGRALQQLGEADRKARIRDQATHAVSTNASPRTTPRRDKAIQATTPPEPINEKDRGIGQARAMIRRLLSITD